MPALWCLQHKLCAGCKNPGNYDGCQASIYPETGTTTITAICFQNLKIRDQPRKLIDRIEGIKFYELLESNWFCGGAGTYNITCYDLSMKILQRKMDNLRKTNATVLLSSCPGCLVQLSYGIRKFNVPVTVKHIVQLLSESIQVD